MNTKFYAALISLLLAFGSGLGLGWKLWMGKTTTVYREIAAPAIKLPNGGEVLEKKIAKKPSIKQELPADSTVLEEGSIIFEPTQPVTPAHHDGVPDQLAEPPKKYTINFAIVKLGDNERRVVASSPDGAVVGGIDVVIDPPKQTAPLLNAVGVSYQPGKAAWGLWATRDWKFLRLGAEVSQVKLPELQGKTNYTAAITCGIRF